MTEDDKKLVEQLRHNGSMPPYYDAPGIQRDAAARIESLSAEVERVTKERDEAREMLTRLSLATGGVQCPWIDAVSKQAAVEHAEKIARVLQALDGEMCKLAALEARVAKLVDALTDAKEHLEYTGYGDRWERECAREHKLPEKIDAALEENRRG